MKKIFTLISAFLLFAACFGQNTWSTIASFGGGERERAVSFVVGGRAYVGTGLDTSNTCKKDFWEYDPGSNSWSQKADLPGSQRRDAIAFAIGNRGYVGTGINGFIAWTGSKKDDFYEYNPITNTWTEKDDWEGNFGGGVYYASAFATPLKGYLVCGKLGSSYYSNELWEYDPVTDDWVKKANFPAGTRYGASAFSIAGKGYVGCGADEDYYRNDFYEYDPQTNIWKQIADFPGSPRFNAVGLEISGRGFVGLGTDGGYQKDFYEYNPATDTWMQKASIPGSERRSCVAFTIGNYGYVGTGKGPDGVKRSMYKYKPYFLAVPEDYNDTRLATSVSPNPMHQNTVIGFDKPLNMASANLKVFNTNGVMVFAENNSTEDNFNFYRNDLAAGIYLYEIQIMEQDGNAKYATGKIYIQ